MSMSSLSSKVHFSQASLLLPVILYLQDRGISVDAYLQEAGISSVLMQEQSNLLSRRLVFQFINDICDAEGIEDIGLLVGQNLSLQKMGEIGQWMLNGQTVHDYLRRGCKRISEVSTAEYYWLSTADDQLRFYASVIGLEEKDKVQNYLYILLITLNTISEEVGGWFPEQINLPGLSLEAAAKLSEKLPHTRIQRHGNYAYFPVPDDVLNHPLKSGHLTSLENTFVLPTDFLSAMRLLMRNHVIESRTDIISFSQSAGLNQRTLQRRLTACGTSFSQLLTEERIELARQWIGGQDYSISEIAARLGYTDPTNFSRAFRRVTGVSPRVYAKELLMI
jgi:AraC-like DNA-binding protein